MKIKSKILVIILISMLFIPTSFTMSKNYIKEKDQYYLQNDYSTFSDIGWHLDQIDIYGAWDKTFGSKDIIIAVIDSGIDFSHSEINTSWINVDEIPANAVDDDGNGYTDDTHGWDFVSNDNLPGIEDPADPIHWHATFIAGLISAPLNNLGIVGVAPNVTIMDIRVLKVDNYAGTTDEGLGDAIKYAVDNGADVINLSLQYYNANISYYDDILYAINNNTPVVSVTGNNWGGGLEIPSYPGAYAEVIAVGATNYFYAKAYYSNYGLPWTEIMAPVGDAEPWIPSQIINSTLPSPPPLYGNGVGTSFAAPQVAAVIALMRTINYTMPVSEIRSILQTTAIDLGVPGVDIFFGHGLLNATAAVMEVWNRTYPPVVPEFETLHPYLLLCIIISTVALIPIILRKQRIRKL